MESKRESARERLAKWKQAKGRPPGPEKPWLPLRKCNSNNSVNVSNMSRNVQVLKSPSKENVPEIIKPELRSLKRSRTTMNALCSSVSNAPKRCRTNAFQEINKENIVSTQTIGETGETSEVVRHVKTASGAKETLQKSKRELLSEWKKIRQLRSDKNTSKMPDFSCNTRRMTITTVVHKKPDSLKSSQFRPQGRNSVLNLTVLGVGSKRRETVVIEKSNVSSVKQRPEETSVLKTRKSSIMSHRSSPLKIPPKLTGRSTNLISEPSIPASFQRNLQIPDSDALIDTTECKTDLSASCLDNSRQSNTKPLPSMKRASVHQASVDHHKSPMEVRSLKRKFNPLLRKQPFPLRKMPVHSKMVCSSLPQAYSMPNVSNSSIVRKSNFHKNIEVAKRSKKNDINQNCPPSSLHHSQLANPKRRIPTVTTKLLPKVVTNKSRLNLPGTPRLSNFHQLPDKSSARKSHSGILKSLRTPSVHKSVAFELPFAGHSCSSPSRRQRLSAWLLQQNKTPTNFRHLQCFDVDRSEVEDTLMQRTPPFIDTSSNFTSLMSSPNSCSNNKLYAGHTPVYKKMQCNVLPKPESTVGPSELELKTPETEVEPERLKKYQCILEEVITLLNASFSPQAASVWLDTLYECTQTIRKLSVYWICRAKVCQMSGNIPEAVDLIEMGIACNAQPSDVLHSSKVALLALSKSVSPYHMATPKSLGIDPQNAFSSTVIQYFVKDKMPVCQTLSETKLQLPTPVTVTPVRRSSRLSNVADVSQHLATPHFSNFTSHCVSSLDDIPEDFRSRMILVPNRHLKMLMESPPEFDNLSFV